MKSFIGIDPGKLGGIAIIVDNIELYPIPLHENGDVDEASLLSYLRFIEHKYGNLYIAIEDVHSMFGMSAASNFSFGYICGELNALIRTLDATIVKVQPKRWQQEIWMEEDIVRVPAIDKDTKLPKLDKEGNQKYRIDTKATSLRACKRIFPDVNVSIKPRSALPHDGVVDALLIAEWCRRTNK